HLNVAAMFADDTRYSVQAQTGSLANAFRRKERLEDMRLHVGRDARPIVSDFYYHAIVFTISSDAQLTLSVHGINRFVNNVGLDLVEFAAERVHKKRNTLILALHGDAALELVVQDGQRGLQ